MKKALLLFSMVLALGAMAFGQSNKSMILSGLRCSATPTTIAVTASGLTGAATGNGGIQFWTVDNAGGTLRVTCPIELPTRFGSKSTVTSVDFFYATQTTAPTGMAAMTVNSVAYPVSGGTATGTVAAAGGALTVTPSPLVFTASTTGVCQHEHVSFGTPITLVPGFMWTIEHILTFGANTGTFQVCQIVVNYKDIQ